MDSRLQSLCSGNMLVCKEYYYISGDLIFEKGRSYSIEKVFDHDILVDNGNGGIWFDNYHLWKYFYTDKEIRKQKLEKLCYGFKK